MTSLLRQTLIQQFVHMDLPRFRGQLIVFALRLSSLVSRLTSLVLYHRGVCHRRREKLWFAELTVDLSMQRKRLCCAGTP